MERLRLSPLLALALLLPALAHAQTARVASVDLSRGVTLPPIGAALADETTSVAINPAGLSLLQGPELFYLHERNIGLNALGDGLFLGTGLDGVSIGFAEEWLRDAFAPRYRRTTWSLAFGNRLLSLGASLHLYTSGNHDLDSMHSLDVGLISQPTEWLSLGFAIQNVGEMRHGPYLFHRHFDVGVGVRPLRNERLTVGVDLLASSGQSFSNGALQGTVDLELIRGLHLNAGISRSFLASDTVRFQVGLTLNGPHFGVGYAAGNAPGGLDHLIAVRISQRAYRGITFGRGKIALFDLHDLLHPSPNLVSAILTGAEENPYLRLQRLMEAAIRDPELSGVVVKISGFDGGIAHAQELRNELLALRQAGKKVLCVLLSADDESYLIASAADRIDTVPQAMLQLTGLSPTVVFLGGTMRKIGVHWDVARVGQFKNAPDQLTRNDMSPAQKTALTAYLDTEAAQLDEGIEKGRKLTADQLAAIRKVGLIPPDRAVKLGLVDAVIDPNQLDDELAKLIPGASYDASYLTADRRITRWGERPEIAVVPILGDIVGGKGAKGPFGGAQLAGAQTVVAAIRGAASDPAVAAIVLRVDSPGGDGLASDLIYRAVLEAKKSKPVVVSMGDLAASGGYYASVGADAIWALPTTLTGSIGVFILKPSLQGLDQKLGINAVTLRRGPLSGLFDVFSSWTPAEQKAAQNWVNAFYDQFITVVAKSRKLKKDHVDTIARGRIWSGKDAVDRGLVDHLGGFLDAVADAEKRAGIAPGSAVKLVTYDGPEGIFSGGGPAVLTRLVGNAPTLDAKPLDALGRAVGLDPELLRAVGLQARLPFVLHAR